MTRSGFKLRPPLLKAALGLLHHTACQKLWSLEPFFQLLERTLTSVPQFPHLQDVEKDPPRSAGVSWARGKRDVCVWAGTPTWLPLASAGSSGLSLGEASSTLPTAWNRFPVAAWRLWSSGWASALTANRASLACCRALLAFRWAHPEEEEEQHAPRPGLDQPLGHSRDQRCSGGEQGGGSSQGKSGLGPSHKLPVSLT